MLPEKEERCFSCSSVFFFPRRVPRARLDDCHDSLSELLDDDDEYDRCRDRRVPYFESFCCLLSPALSPRKAIEVDASIGGVGVAAGEQQLQHKHSWA